MKRIKTPSGVMISHDTNGAGPPLVLVHESFSDHNTNWQEVKPLLKDRFSAYAVARRGRGDSSATHGHSIWDEATDVAAILRQVVGEPAFLLGHSYGALCALEAAALNPGGVGKLILYEPPLPHIFITAEQMARLETFAASEDWDGLVQSFMLDFLQVPPDEVKEIRATPQLWDVWTADARATVNDLRALVNHRTEYLGQSPWPECLAAEVEEYGTSEGNMLLPKFLLQEIMQ